MRESGEVQIGNTPALFFLEVEGGGGGGGITLLLPEPQGSFLFNVH